VSHLSQVAKDVVASHGTLVTMFERIQLFLQRLSSYTQIPLTVAMTELLGKIMGQVLSILALSTKEMTQKRMSERNSLDVSLFANYRTERFLRRLVGRTDVEDALERLDMLTKEESIMTVTRNLTITHVVERGVNVVGDAVKAIKDGAQISLNLFKCVSTNSLYLRNRRAKTSVVSLLSRPPLSNLNPSHRYPVSREPSHMAFSS
jgi:hypothetical protein